MVRGKQDDTGTVMRSKGKAVPARRLADVLLYCPPSLFNISPSRSREHVLRDGIVKRIPASV